MGLLLLLSCGMPKTSIMEKGPMPAIGSVTLSSLDNNADASLYREFLRQLIMEASAEPLEGSDVTRFEIIEADDFKRWMVIDFSAKGADYRIEGQLLSPDILFPTDQSLYFHGRIAYSSANFSDAPLDLTNSKDAFKLVAPVLQSLSRRVCGIVGLPKAAG